MGTRTTHRKSSLPTQAVGKPINQEPEPIGQTYSLGTQSPPLNTSPGKKLHWLPISERIKYKVACMCFSAINGSGLAYLSELLHVYTPSRTLRSSSDTRMLEIQQYNAVLMAFAPSLSLDPTF